MQFNARPPPQTIEALYAIASKAAGVIAMGVISHGNR
jgi:hypothetical protein